MNHTCTVWVVNLCGKAKRGELFHVNDFISSIKRFLQIFSSCSVPSYHSSVVRGEAGHDARKPTTSAMNLLVELEQPQNLQHFRNRPQSPQHETTRQQRRPASAGAGRHPSAVTLWGWTTVFSSSNCQYIYCCCASAGG